MPSILQNPKYKVLTIILIPIVLMLFGLFVYQQFIAFRLVSTNPNTNKVSFLTPYMDVTFSKPLDQTPLNEESENGITIKADNDIVTKIDINKSVLRLYLSGQKIDQTYKITIPTLKSTDGKVLTNTTIVFKAKNIAFEKLPKDQQKYSLALQDQMPQAFNDPILAHLPHSTLDYELKAVLSGGDKVSGSLVLEAKLLLSAADIRIGPEAAKAQYKTEVLDYITSLGLDPNNYTINYTTNY